MSTKPGYTGKILRVNLDTANLTTVPTEIYADRFLGGRGIAAKVHWDEVPPGVTAFDSKNRLVFMTGPICGIPGVAGGRWQICAKSPVHNRFSYANLGGAWGIQLKYAGYDGLIVHGKAHELVYLLIDDERVELRDAKDLTGMGAIVTRERLKEMCDEDYRVVAIGPAGENMVSFATLLADSDASGSAGMGAVMGSKNLKAIAVRGHMKVKLADQERLRLLRKKVRELNPISLPWPTMLPQEGLKKAACLGCTGCNRQTYTSAQGRSGKYMCQSNIFYESRALKYYGEVTEVPFQVTKLCDDYGLDTRALAGIITWLSACKRENILTEKETGLPLSKIGSLEYMERLLYQISFKKGFGQILAGGTHRAVEKVKRDSGKLISDYMTKHGDRYVYGPRLYITTGLFNAVEPRQPIQHLHEIADLIRHWLLCEKGKPGSYVSSDVVRGIAKKFWGGELAADFSTYEGKALAATKIQDRQYAKESLILCDFAWPLNHSPITPDHVGDPTLESQICSAVTGLEIDEDGLNKLGERVFNLQRAVLVREGHKGRKYDSIEEFEFTVGLKEDVFNADCLVPGRNGRPISRKGMVVDKIKFEKMKDEFYAIRGWDIASGLQKSTKLAELGLGDVAQELARLGLAV